MGCWRVFLSSFPFANAGLSWILDTKMWNDVKYLSSNNSVKSYSNNLTFCIYREAMDINKSLELEFAISTLRACNANSKVLLRKISFFESLCHTSWRVDWLWLSSTLYRHAPTMDPHQHFPPETSDIWFLQLTFFFLNPQVWGDDE